MKTPSIWYDGGELLTKGRLLNFIVGLRGGGKTFYWKKKALNDFINKGEQFIWLRRYQTELNEMSNWASALQRKGYFLENKIEVNKKYVKVDGKIAGYVATLSKAQHLKSTEFPGVTKIIFDEFLITNSVLRYLKDEATVLLDIMETVFRDRDKGCTVICIGNAISVVNPYFVFFNITPDIEKHFTLKDQVLIELYNNTNYSDMKKQSRLGKLTSGTDWGNYAYENKFLLDNYSFVQKREGKLVYLMGIKYKGNFYGVWTRTDVKEEYMYIDRVFERNNTDVLIVDIEDLDEKYKLKRSENIRIRCDILRMMFNEGLVYYSDLETKKNMYYVIKTL